MLLGDAGGAVRPRRRAAVCCVCQVAGGFAFEHAFRGHTQQRNQHSTNAEEGEHKQESSAELQRGVGDEDEAAQFSGDCPSCWKRRAKESTGT